MQARLAPPFARQRRSKDNARRLHLLYTCFTPAWMILSGAESAAAEPLAIYTCFTPPLHLHYTCVEDPLQGGQRGGGAVGVGVEGDVVRAAVVVLRITPDLRRIYT